MLFNSYEFIFVLFPMSTVLYYSFNKYANFFLGKLSLLCCSMIMLAYVSFYHAAWLILSVLFNFCINEGLVKKSEKKKTLLGLGMSFNVLFLVFFKYTNSLTASTRFVMPIGISFYTFQQIAYLVDNYRERVHERYSLFDYLLFVVFFPKILQGPIVYHNELIPQFNDPKKKKVNYYNLSSGLFVFSIGLAKKVLVADVLGIIVDYGYKSINSLNSFETVLVIFGYSLQLYFDFSGYCDMANGIARMLNFDLPDNFNSPYKALNIGDFWKRWHITLTRFLTKYIYVPLGGNRRGRIRTYTNILIVYLISGIWHGVGLTFLLWGLIHGLLTIIYRIVRKDYDRISNILQWLINFIFVNIAWVFFRAPDINSAIGIFRRLFVGPHILQINNELTESLLQPTIINAFSQFIPLTFVIMLLYLFLIVMVLYGKNSKELVSEFKPKWSNLMVSYLLLMLSVCSISGVTSFLYVNF